MKDLNQHMTAAEYRRLHGADAPEKKRPKIPHKRTLYNGRWYHCQEEAYFAKYLDLFSKKDPTLFYGWEPQKSFIIPGITKTGRNKHHRVDFAVTLLFSMRLIYIEIKGEWTDYHNPIGKERRETVEDLYGIKINVFKKAIEAINFLIQEARQGHEQRALHGNLSYGQKGWR